MEHIFKVLPSVLSKRGLRVHAEAALVVHRAQQWIDDSFPALKEALKVSSFQDGVLLIATSHAIASQECHAALPALLEYLKQNCPFADLAEIRLQRELRKAQK